MKISVQHNLFKDQMPQPGRRWGSAVLAQIAAYNTAIKMHLRKINYCSCIDVSDIGLKLVNCRLQGYEGRHESQACQD